MLAENDLTMELHWLQGPGAQVLSQYVVSWTPPPKDCLKLNVDAGWKEGVAAVVILTRDDVGGVIDMWSEKFMAQSVLEVKARAILKGSEVTVSQLSKNSY